VTISAIDPPAPVAKFTVSRVSGYAPLAVKFTNSTAGQVNTWAWDFGDGSNSVEKSPVHLFGQPGTYTVTLTASGLSGTSTRSVTITALQPPAPVAKFTPSTVRGYAPLAVKFTNASTGQVNTWAWDFGNGSNSSDKSPTHVFDEPGTYTVTLTATGLTDPASSRSITINVLRPGLVAAYGFEEASGTGAVDITGRGQTGAIYAATRTDSGKFGKALAFNGVNSWVSVKHAAAQAITRSVTLQAWVRPTAATSGWRNVLMKEQPGGAVYELYADTGSGKPAGGVYTTAENMVHGGSSLAPNVWSHVATTYDGTTQRLFVNGVEVASRAQVGPLRASSYPLRIGGNNVWGEYFDGVIDEVRVYNRALAPSEIQKDMSIPVVAGAQ
jgi:PKD repeat protein